jgi:hypothetical protein
MKGITMSKTQIKTPRRTSVIKSGKKTHISEIPKLVFMCVGESSRNIYQHLEYYHTQNIIIPHFVENKDDLKALFQSNNHSMKYVVSKLDDPVYFDMLGTIEEVEPRQRTFLNALLIHPFHQDVSVLVDRNLKKSLLVFFNIRLFYWSDYLEEEKESVGKIKWLNESLDRSEKSIIWGILQRYDWGGRLIRTKQYGKRTFYDEYMSHTNR